MVFTTARQLDTLLFIEWAKAVERSVGEFKPHDLANLAWEFATVEEPDDKTSGHKIAPRWHGQLRPWASRMIQLRAAKPRQCGMGIFSASQAFEWASPAIT